MARNPLLIQEEGPLGEGMSRAKSYRKGRMVGTRRQSKNYSWSQPKQ
jgi:hypothetical protein